MSYRFMRILVMFDLPTETSLQRRNYRKFRKTLIKNGFIMMQESVYVKFIRKICPDEGIVQVLQITEKQFSKMEFLVGESQTEYVDNNERLLEL